MILPFMTHFPNGKPTYFLDTITENVAFDNYITDSAFRNISNQTTYEEWFQLVRKYRLSIPPKIHTLRIDKNNRWKEGMKIHFYLWNRTKRATCFGILPCTGVQTVMIDARNKKVFLPDEDGREIDVSLIASNDGFANIEAFWEYFNKTETYKLIHWTDFKY